mgnify:CR=1 FL=1
MKIKEDKIKEDLKKFVLEEFFPKGRQLSDEESLFHSGIIDSLGVIKLTAFLENNFKVIVNPSEVSMDKFNTINEITRFISEKIENSKS